MAVRDDWAPGEVLTSTDLNDTFASKLDLAGGKILQIVRATPDTTQRSTTSTSNVDANISVTIQPQYSTSFVLIVWSAVVQAQTNSYINLVITDSSNTAITGAERFRFGADPAGTPINGLTLIGYATPATTSAVTYKGRFRVQAGTGYILNDQNTGQMFAIEVSA